MYNHTGKTYTLNDLALWLKYESWCQDFDGLPTPRERTETRTSRRSVSILHGGDSGQNSLPSSPTQTKPPPYCAYCDSRDHHISQCNAITNLNQEQLTDWIRTNKRCWRCARPHLAAQCTLKKPCNLCQGRHLQVLHDVNCKNPKAPAPHSAPVEGDDTATDVLYLDHPTESGKVLLKVVPVILHHNGKTLNTHAVLDDGSERTMLLPAAAQMLNLQGCPETLPLRTIRQDVQTLHGSCVSFDIFPGSNPKIKHRVNNAFTATRIDLAEHTYPVDALKKKYRHLKHLPLRPFKKVKPLLLIGSDHPHLITSTEPVRLGPPGGPAAIRTRLGWTLQGPSGVDCQLSQPQQCLFASITTEVSEHIQKVGSSWQADSIPVKTGSLVAHSREDKLAASARVATKARQQYTASLQRRVKLPPTRFSSHPSVRHSEGNDCDDLPLCPEFLLQRRPGKDEFSPAEFHGAANGCGCPPVETATPASALKREQPDCSTEDCHLLKGEILIQRSRHLGDALQPLHSRSCNVHPIPNGAASEPSCLGHPKINLQRWEHPQVHNYHIRSVDIVKGTEPLPNRRFGR